MTSATLKEEDYTVTKRGLFIKKYNSKKADKEGVVISYKEIEIFAKYFCPMTDMAKYFGVSEAVIRKHFTQTVIQTQTKVKQRIRQKQVSMALAGDKTLLIWLGKNYLDQSDNGVKNDDAKQPLPWDDE